MSSSVQSVDKYIYRVPVTRYMTNTFLRNVNGVLYLLGNQSDQGYTWVTMMTSLDDGETWDVEDVPVTDEPCYDPKLVVINDVFWYVFAHGPNANGVDTIKFTVRSVDDEGVGEWSDWTYLLEDQSVTARVTDAMVIDDYPTIIHVVYDAAVGTGHYTVHYGMFLTTDLTLTTDTVIHSTPAYDQNNARLAVVNENTIAIVYEQGNPNRVQQVDYVEHDFLTDAWSSVLTVSRTPMYNNYHPSITTDDDGTVHIAWLRTSTSFASSAVLHTYVVGATVAAEEVIIDDLALEDDRYPWIFTTNGDLYVLTNLAHSTVQYLVRRDGDDDWTEVTSVTENTWVLLNGWCTDRNVYTVSRDVDEVVYFTRIDTDLAEKFEPINDLQVASADAVNVTFVWTKARNAERIYLERLEADVWSTATVLIQTGATDTSAHAVNLPDGLFKFRVLYTLADGTTGYVAIPGKFENNEERDLLVTWEPMDGSVAQKLQVSRETWSVMTEVPPTHDEITIALTGEVTMYRLNVIGGVAAGLSNQTRPLVVELNMDDNVQLGWSTFADAVDVIVEQSIDDGDWYPAITDEVIAPTTTACTISNLERVVYRFRLNWRLSSGRTLISNVVTVVNCLRCLEYDWSSALMSWVDVDIHEVRYMQWSVDRGASWTTAVNAISQHTMRVTGLHVNREHLLRLYFPNRFTGVTSNIVAVHTTTRPIDDLVVSNVGAGVAQVTFSIDDAYDDMTLHFVDTVTGVDHVYSLKGRGRLRFILDDGRVFPVGGLLSDDGELLEITQYMRSENGLILVTTDGAQHLVYNMLADDGTVVELEGTGSTGGSFGGDALIDVDEPVVNHRRFTVIVNTLPMGTYLNAYVDVVGGDRAGNSNVVSLVTTGVGPGDVVLEQMTDPHVLRLTAGPLERITATNVDDNIMVAVSRDGGVHWVYRLATEDTVTASVTSVGVTVMVGGLMQRTRYVARLVVAYGDNYGASAVVEATTAPGPFRPVYGERRPGERRLLPVGTDWLVVDQGRFYLVTATEQRLLYDEGIVAPHAYVATVMLGNLIYAVVAHAHRLDVVVLTFTNDTLTKTARRTIADDRRVNEYMSVDAFLRNGRLVIAWEEDLGHRSRLAIARLNITDLSGDREVIVDDGAYHHLPRLRATSDGGFVVASVANGQLMVSRVKVNLDRADDAFLQETLTTSTYALDDASVLEEFVDVVVDNLDGLRFAYASVNNDVPTTTYATLIDDEFTVQTVIPRVRGTRILITDRPALIGASGGSVFSTAYVISGTTFADLHDEVIVTDGTPLTIVHAGDDVGLVYAEAGEWAVHRLSVPRVMANVTVDGAWIANEMEIELTDAVVGVWTLGDPDDYPMIFLRCNAVTRDVTPRDELGQATLAAVHVTDLVEIIDDDLVTAFGAEAKAAVKIVHEGGELPIDLTDWLYYPWDHETIVNTSDVR